MRFNKAHLFSLFCALTISALHASAQEALDAQDMPQHWQYASAFDQTIPTSDHWWRQFDDPMLDSLITLGIANNYNVLMAQRRIQMARQALRQTRSAYFPQLSLSGGWQKARTSGMTGSVAGSAMTGDYFNLGIDMQWEIDVFGKITSRAKENKAAYNATRAEYAATMVTVSAKIASAYFQLRSLQAEIAVMDRHIASQDTVLKVAIARHEAGLASQVDVAQAKTTYYSTLASITSLKTSETSTINALAVLLGVFPSDVDAMLRKLAPLPDYHQLVAVGVPMELLRRRPDIVEAECQLAQYAAAVGVAKKDFLPTIALSGSIGTSAHKLGDLFDNQSLTYAIAPTLSWTIFEGFARSAALSSAKEQLHASIDSYNLTLVTAVQEVESAMAAYVNDMQYIEYLDQVVSSAYQSLQLSFDLYKQGLTAFINVTNAQITLLQYANERVLAQGQALNDLVTLYESLGGGWQQ